MLVWQAELSNEMGTEPAILADKSGLQPTHLKWSG